MRQIRGCQLKLQTELSLARNNHQPSTVVTMLGKNSWSEALLERARNRTATDRDPVPGSKNGQSARRRRARLRQATTTWGRWATAKAPTKAAIASRMNSPPQPGVSAGEHRGSSEEQAERQGR
jgi:hypothetical protein